MVAADELAPAGSTEGGVLPSYVTTVLRGQDGVVFLVDLEQMVLAVRRSSPGTGAQT